MISLQSHNQVLYHLTQLASAITPRTSTYSTRVRKRHEKNAENLCQESLEEAAKNCTEISLKNLNIRKTSELPSRFSKRDINGILNYINRVPRPLDAHDSWKVSYISGSSFLENKHGFPCSPSSTSTVLAARYYVRKPDG